MKYITITAPHPRKYYVARELIGGDYTIICTCPTEQSAKDIAEKLRMFAASGTVTVEITQRKKKVA
jgi:hypothetical protein